jgi:hypothetical protein
MLQRLRPDRFLDLAPPVAAYPLNPSIYNYPPNAGNAAPEAVPLPPPRPRRAAVPVPRAAAAAEAHHVGPGAAAGHRRNSRRQRPQ